MSEKYSAGDEFPATDANQIYRGGSSVVGLLAGETINGATLPVPVYQSSADNEFYACIGNDTTKMVFVGFAISNSTNGNAITIQFEGIVKGFTGLTEGVSYYISDTSGVISTTVGTYSIPIGTAISESELLIKKGIVCVSGVLDNITTAYPGADHVLTTNFKPDFIDFFIESTAEGNSVIAPVHCISKWSGNTSVSSGIDAPTLNFAPWAATNLGQIYTHNGGFTSNGITFSVSATSTTGFTFTVARNRDASGWGGPWSMHYIAYKQL
jgi:hypothetical protein